MVDSLRGCHQALAGTRGAAISIISVDLQAGALTYGGVGNVEGRLCQGGKEQRLISDRGIAGVVLPTIRPLSLSLAAPWLVILHSDGVRARFEVGRLPNPSESAVQQLVDDLLAQWSRPADDATVAAMRSTAEPDEAAGPAQAT